MKVFISSDIEGTCGICHWDETEPGKSGYEYFRNLMSKEVLSVCKGINHYDGSEIIIKDAHDTARNLDISIFPENTRVIRGWTRDPYIMMSGIDKSYDASIFTGYHSGGGSNGSPLSHTMSGSTITYMKINDIPASEFLMNYYTSLYFSVPVVMVSGDKALCKSVNEIDEKIHTVTAYESKGNAVISNHPSVINKKLESEAMASLKDLKKYNTKLPGKFKVELCFRQHYMAYRASFYNGVKQIDDMTVLFETEDYLEFLKMFFFTT